VIAPAVVTAAYVRSHVEAALADVDSFIIRTAVATAPGQVTTTWTDPVTGTTRTVVTGARDRVTEWVTTRVAGDRDHWLRTFVDYSHRTWRTSPKVSGRLGRVAPGAWIVVSADTSAGQVRAALKLGELSIAGRGRVGGRPAYELRYTHGKAAALAYWVDARTYRPVRMVLPPGGPANVISIAWLARTPALVTTTNKPQIPAGFTHVR
jgi:hypothetical protein